MEIICRLREVIDAHYVPGTIHGLLKTYLKRHSPITKSHERRVRAIDLPLHVWSQYATLHTMWALPGDATGIGMPASPPSMDSP